MLNEIGCWMKEKNIKIFGIKMVVVVSLFLIVFGEVS